MSTLPHGKTFSAMLASAVVLSSLGVTAQAQTNPLFSATTVSEQIVLAGMEHKCGEGKCGSEEADSGHEGTSTTSEGSCGEGVCGEGQCGGSDEPPEPKD